MSTLTTLFRISLFVFLWVISPRITAQDNAYWIEGKVTFKKGEPQYCVLNYDATVSEGLLQVKEGKKILTYTTKDIEAFSFFDDYAGCWRKFYAFPLYLVRGGVVRDFFMELVYNGSRWSILRKKERWVGSLAYRTLSPETYFVQRPEQKVKYARYYEVCYMLNMETGEVEELTKSLFFASVDDKKQEIRNYIKEKRLRFHTIEDFVSLLDYYHRLPMPSEEQSGILSPAVKSVPVMPIPGRLIPTGPAPAK